MMYCRFLIFFIFVLALTSCEKAVEFELEETAPKLVVEATIENDRPPVVVLTRSLNYFAAINPQLLAGSFVHNAVVTVSNGVRTHQLKEYTTPVGGGFNLYFYSIDSSSLATAFLGELNRHYTLQILHDGKEYSAQTSVPALSKKIDSAWWKPAPADVDSNKAIVMVKATDPPGYGDYIRYFTKRNDKPFYPGFNSVFDDFFVDGTTYELQVEPGADRNVERKEGDAFFNKGDTVTFKLSNIDKATYDFWRTMEYSYASVGNPFSTPIKVVGNISGGALGYFGGYASQYRTVIIPR